MAITAICSPKVLCTVRSTSVLDAAKLMREHQVGDLVVIEARDGRRFPVGIVTDRDMVMQVLAPDHDPAEVTVGDIMIPDIATANENTDIYEAIQMMRMRGTRILPVLDESQALIGIVSNEDLQELLAEEMADLSRVAPHERTEDARRT